MLGKILLRFFLFALLAAAPCFAEDRYLPFSSPPAFSPRLERLPPVEPEEAPPTDKSSEASAASRPTPFELNYELEEELKLEELETEEPISDDYWSSLWEFWEGSVELGLSGTDGNTQTFNMHFGVEAKYETPHIIHTYEFSHVNKSADASRTAFNTLADGRVEWIFTESPWSFFMHGSNEYDQFKAFDFRLAGDSGIGYKIFDNDAAKLVSRLGGSVSREIGGPKDEYVPELTAGLEWKHTINQYQKISAKSEYFPDVTRFGEFRFNTKASLETAISPDWGLSLKFSVVDRYDSTPNGSRSNDLDYSALLLWSF